MNEVEFHKVSVFLGDQHILNDVSFSAKTGELVALLGPNGVGKTTLLRAASGLISYQGRILIGKDEVCHVSPGRLGRLFSYIPQGHEVHWPMSVKNIVALGRLPFTDTFSLRGDDEEIVVEALRETNLRELADRQYSQLSGGEKSRVMIARALANGSNLMLADEPTAALDPYHQLQVLEMLRRRVDKGLCAVVILHDLVLAAQFADRIMLMHDKHIIADGKPEETLRKDLLETVYGIRAAQNFDYKKGLWKRVDL